MTEEIKNKLEKIIGMMGFSDFSVSYDEEGRRFSVFINQSDISENQVVSLATNLDYLVKLVGEKCGLQESVFIDVNNYRKEREKIIIELAKAAARKVAATKEEISLPVMNAYERRLVHMELSSRPDVSTESVGESKSRYVVIKPLS
jgi:predicted RNA-binding protein Jag